MSAADRATDPTSERERSPEELRREIEDTREDLGDTVEALAGKADVKAQAKQRAAAAKEAATRKKDELAAKVKATSPESANAGAQQVAATAKQNPVPLVAGAAFVLGLWVGRHRAR